MKVQELLLLCFDFGTWKHVKLETSELFCKHPFTWKLGSLTKRIIYIRYIHVYITLFKRMSIRNQTFFLRYTTSMHWSLTQFTPASMSHLACHNVQFKILQGSLYTFCCCKAMPRVQIFVGKCQWLWTVFRPESHVVLVLVSPGPNKNKRFSSEDPPLAISRRSANEHHGAQFRHWCAAFCTSGLLFLCGQFDWSYLSGLFFVLRLKDVEKSFSGFSC